MKVAIMGAGLSGLACAITLEKQGIKPTVFEKRSCVGDRFVNGEAFLPALNRPINDCFAYLADKHGIYLQPLSNIRKIVFFSENNSAEVNGFLGFVNLRGRESESIECQLARQVSSEIIFNSEATYEQLLQEYTHIVLATGDAAYSSKIQDFRVDLTVTLRGATVEGAFERNVVAVWLDHTIAPKGYAFLIPYSEEEACITLAYPDYPENRKQDISVLWENFLARTQKDLEQTLKITDKFEITRYIIGMCERPRLGNTFFTGNCFGAIMPAFGFGQITSILTGIYAAQDLCGLGNYPELVKPLRDSYHSSLIIRRGFEKLNNSKLDALVALIDRKMTNDLLVNEKYNPLKILSYMLRPFLNERHH